MSNDDKLIQRIEDVLNHLRFSVFPANKIRFSQKELSIQIDMAQGNISNAKKGDKRYINALIDKINNRFGNIFNERWYLYGEGEMLQNRFQPPANYQSEERSINVNHQGTFTKPINTVIGDNNNFGGRAVKNDPKKKDDLKLKAICADLEADLQRCQMENDYLRHKVESLESQLKQAIADKERAMADKDKAMAMLDKLINK